jgi:SAM-dependent methyltransferase
MMLENTRERALPQHHAQTLEDYLVYLKHVALYDFAKTFCAQKIVLDLGCGEGYGSAALAPGARYTIAADNSFDAVAHASVKYARANLAFVVCDAQWLPFRSDAFDVVISFEVIEHIGNVRAYLDEIKRVNVGIALISTPNRLLRLLPFQKPWNRFHRREYDYCDLARALSAVFARVQVRGVTAIPAILAIEKRRVKQSPFTAYPKMVAQMLLPQLFYDRLMKVKSRRTPVAEGAGNFDAARFSPSDFKISETGLRECITLLAICGR